MKSKIILLVTALLFLNISFSQGFGPRKERIKALKVAFITDKLNLTSEEAAKFWPVYNAFEEKQFDIRYKKINVFLGQMRGEGGLKNIGEKEAQTLLNQIENAEDELHNLRQKLTNDLRPILPAIKILKLKKAEEEFNRHLLEKIKERREK